MGALKVQSWDLSCFFQSMGWWGYRNNLPLLASPQAILFFSVASKPSDCVMRACYCVNPITFTQAFATQMEGF